MEDIKETLKEIKIIQFEIKSYKEDIALLHNSLKYEREHRQELRKDISLIEEDIQFLENKVNKNELKIKEVDIKVEELIAFRKDMKNFFWRFLFIILGSIGTVLAAYFSSNK